jgi:hypothetical protein
MPSTLSMPDTLDFGSLRSVICALTWSCAARRSTPLKLARRLAARPYQRHVRWQLRHGCELGRRANSTLRLFSLFR